MPDYQRKRISDMTNVGDPGPLPVALNGLPDEVLANLPQYMEQQTLAEMGLSGAGFFPVAPEPPPAPIRRLDRILFLQRIPQGKRMGIHAARPADAVLHDFLYMLEATNIVELDEDDTQLGVAYLVDQDLLTEAEAEALLA